MRIERHVFGSRQGYTTLAQSDGISESERRLLETFAFGQTNDQRYLNSLAQNPAYISRPLGHKRRAITRVLLGQPDDQGRITLLFPTAIISAADWEKTLRGDVWPLMRLTDLWQWDGREKLDRLTVGVSGPDPLSLAPEEARGVLGILSELERQYASGRSLVLEGTRFAPTIIRTVDMLMPDEFKPEFSSSARSLSANIDVRVNCVARGANIVGAGAMSVMYRPRAEDPMTPYALALLDEGLMRGTVPWGLVHDYDEFGQKMVDHEEVGEGFEVLEDLARRPRRAQAKMSARTKLILAVTGFVLLALAVLGFGIYRKGASAAQRQALVKKAESLADISPADFILRSRAEQDSLLKDARELDDKISDDAEIGMETARKLQKWVSRQEDVRAQLAKKREALDKLQASLRRHWQGRPQVRQEQVAPKELKAIQADLREAGLAEDKLRANVDSLTVDLSPTCQGDLRTLEDLAEKLRTDLAARERVYEVFAQKLQRAMRTREPKRAKELTREWEKHWKEWAKNDKAKLERLGGLMGNLTSVGNRPERLEKARSRMEQLIKRLRQPPPKDKEDLNRLQQEYQGALDQAVEFREELITLIEDAKRALGSAQYRLSPKPKTSREDADERAQKNIRAALVDLAGKMAALRKANRLDGTSWPKPLAAVKDAVKTAAKLDKSLGDALQIVVVARTIEAWKRRPVPQPDIHKTEYLVPQGGWGAYEKDGPKNLKLAISELGSLKRQAESDLTGRLAQLGVGEALGKVRIKGKGKDMHPLPRQAIQRYMKAVRGLHLPLPPKPGPKADQKRKNLMERQRAGVEKTRNELRRILGKDRYAKVEATVRNLQKSIAEVEGEIKQVQRCLDTHMRTRGEYKKLSGK